MHQNLHDLDELMLTTRNRESRDYIGEAIAAYRGGVYRAAVVATWTAVAFDIFGKIRELAGQGDAAAESFVRDLEKAIASSNTTRLLKIERELLNDAGNQFELIDKTEQTQLERLQADRHLCAHPSLTRDAELFCPSPEVVRTHIVHSILYVLRHPPVQGKTALVRLKTDLMNSPAGSHTDLVGMLKTKYFDRAKATLIRSVVIALLKALIRATDPDLVGHEEALEAALSAAYLARPTEYETAMQADLPSLCSDLKPSQELGALRVLRADPRAWRWLEEPTRLQLRHAISTRHRGDPTAVMLALSIQDLREEAIAAVQELQHTDKVRVLSECLDPCLDEVAIELLEGASDFRGAKRLFGKILIPRAGTLSPTRLRRVLVAVRTNNQIHWAFSVPDMLLELWEATSSDDSDVRGEWS